MPCSGTTGRRKGVPASQAQLDAMCHSLIQAWAYAPSDRMLHVLPLNHVHGLVNALFAPLLSGATVEFMPFDPSAVWQRVLAGHTGQAPPLSLFTGVPTMYARLVSVLEDLRAGHGGTDQLRSADAVRAACASQFRVMMSGSAPLPARLATRWQAATGHTLLERYGMTEIGMALSNPLAPVDARAIGEVGVALPGVTWRIAPPTDPHHVLADGRGPALSTAPAAATSTAAAHHIHGGAAAPVDGELLVGGPTVFDGYRGNPQATAESFVVCAATGDRFFRTGDHVQLTPRGTLAILGRLSVDILKSKGYKLSALQIERAILDDTRIADVAVVGMPGEVDDVVTAIVVLAKAPASTEPLTLASLRHGVAHALPTYALPQALITVAAMPRNAMGKVNKKELIQRFQQNHK
ncbi:hypothetical protein CXG81DRAFT_14207 [Caulochytrium protostelioides]|uniref:Acetyl-CoA synthetase-like protein n=1 Tax=Caulochytrium protostelioides TaxID=1555241 RepID=A0A4P9X3S2_9FUNG|nr:hypothetical protein CXG81DRAFT_14207 [Caulochytrium protostelioides]|eukprot:RKO99674.1 hypothetical protein CXG81DRAFT_14207 [Caulochytrium protostelioides]